MGFHEFVVNKPFFLKADEMKIRPTSPDAKGWGILPFYYTLGAWPRAWEGHPIVDELPYEKGPPTRFIGHFIEHWSPDITLTWEGPKTPTGAPGQEGLKQCVLNRGWMCIALRHRALQRHVEEMRKLGRDLRWKLAWFVGENAQGVYLSATSKDREQDRYLLVTPKGTYQAIAMDTPVTPVGEEARRALRTAIGIVRVSDDLAPGRARVDHVLAGIQMKGDESAERLSEIQSDLLAKISVDPSSFDAYYHLGGTSLLLARLLAKGSQVTAPVVTTLSSAYQYARDMRPEDPKTTELEGMAMEAKKY